MNDFEIVAGTRLGEVEIGMTREELVNAIGEASEVEAYEYTEAALKAEDWHFDEFEVSVSFEEANDWTLSTIASSSSNCHFHSLRPIGMSEVNLIEALETLELGTLEKEAFEDEDGDSMTVIRIKELNISFWIEDDEVSEIELKDLA